MDEATPEKVRDLLIDGSKRALITFDKAQKLYESNFSGKVPWSVLDEKIISDHVGFVSYHTHFFYKHFNWKIMQLVESGIAKVIVEHEEKYSWYRDQKIEVVNKLNDEDQKTILTVGLLGPWFIGLMVFLSLSAVVFAIELFGWKNKFSNSKYSSSEKVKVRKKMKKKQPKKSKPQK